MEVKLGISVRLCLELVSVKVSKKLVQCVLIKSGHEGKHQDPPDPFGAAAQPWQEENPMGRILSSFPQVLNGLQGNRWHYRP